MDARRGSGGPDDYTNGGEEDGGGYDPWDNDDTLGSSTQRAQRGGAEMSQGRDADIGWCGGMIQSRGAKGCCLGVSGIFLVGMGFALGLVLSGLVWVDQPPPVTPKGGATGFDTGSVVPQNETVPSAPVPAPTQFQVGTDRLSKIKSTLMSTFTQTSLNFPGTPQATAAEWLANSDPAQIAEWDTFKLFPRYALMVMYLSLNGDEWPRQRNWKTASDTCDWQGITCTPQNGQMQVTEIRLASNNLNGILPEQEMMYFSTTLRKLVLSRNQLQGSLPNDLLNRLTTLETLSLDNNMLSGQVSLYSRLANLQHLVLSGNRLTGTFPAGQLCMNSPHLSELHLYDNGFTSLNLGTTSYSPPNSGFAGGSTGTNNNFGGNTPANNNNGGAGNTVLNNNNGAAFPNNNGAAFPNNNGATFPNNNGGTFNNGGGGTAFGSPFDYQGLQQCRNLRRLWITNNPFSPGPLPDDQNLWESLAKLENLYMDGAGFTGPLPSSLSAASKLTDLRLHNNSFTGPIPPTWSTMTQMNILYLDTNSLSGQIPMFFNSWGSLEHLNLSNNRLSGFLPSTMGDAIANPATQSSSQTSNGVFAQQQQQQQQQQGLVATVPSPLVTLDLSMNQLRGPIPGRTIGLMSRLKRLRLHGNALTGAVPTELAQCPMLEELKLEQVRPNEFAGSGGGVNTLNTVPSSGLTGVVPQGVCTRALGAQSQISVDCGVVCTCCGPCVNGVVSLNTAPAGTSGAFPAGTNGGPAVAGRTRLRHGG